LTCAMQGATLSPIPSPFLKTAVRLKMDAGVHDAALFRYLAALVASNPDEQEWIERLGYARFQEGETAQALRAFEPLIAAPERVEQPGLLIVMAEALRREQHQEKAVELLRGAHRRYPDNVHILNNLVYTLAQRDETVPEARTLLAPLLDHEGNPAVLDTAAVTLFRIQDFERAGHYMDKAVASVGPGAPQWRDIYLDAARMHLDMGNYERARALHREVVQSGSTWQGTRGARLGAAIDAAIAAREAERRNEAQ